MDITELWTQYSSELLGYLKKHTGNIDAAEDILSEVYLSAVRHHTTLANMAPKQCRNWLFTCAKHRFIDTVRKKKIETMYQVIPEPFEDDLTRVMVSEAMSQLPGDLQDLVGMRYFAGLDSVTIGNILGIPPAIVRTKLRKARALLRKYLEK